MQVTHCARTIVIPIYQMRKLKHRLSKVRSNQLKDSHRTVGYWFQVIRVRKGELQKI